MGKQIKKTLQKQTKHSKMVEQALMNSMAISGVSIAWGELDMSEFYKGFMRGLTNSNGAMDIWGSISIDYANYSDNFLDSCLHEEQLAANKGIYDMAFTNVLLDDLPEAGVYLASANLIDMNMTLDGCRDVTGMEEMIKTLLDYVQGKGYDANLTDSMVQTLYGYSAGTDSAAGWTDPPTGTPGPSYAVD